MHTLVLTADDYTLLQQVFNEHFQRSERYMERLIEAILIHSSSLPNGSAQEQRAFIQAHSPEYLFHKRGIATDRAFLEEIRHSLGIQRTMAINTADFYHIANLVVASLAALSPALTPLYEKIDKLTSQPISNDEKVVLVLRVGFSEAV